MPLGMEYDAGSLQNAGYEVKFMTPCQNSTLFLGLHSNLSGTAAVEDNDCQTCHFAPFSMTTGAANSVNTHYCQDCHTTAGNGPVKPQPVNLSNSLIKEGLELQHVLY